MEHLCNIFTDVDLVAKIQSKLPELFQIAELESSRAGKIGMQVGSIRENIIVALLIHKFGHKLVETEIPITEPEIDVKLSGSPISIKTITGKSLSGVKLIWTVDAQKAKEFRQNYYPTCDILFIQINWNDRGGFYYIPLEVQLQIFNQIGRNNYIKLPRQGTNPRGVEFTKNALIELINHPETRSIEIDWKKKETDFNPYKRWVELWESN